MNPSAAPVKALRLHGPREVRLHQEEPPVLHAGEVLVRVTAAGLCGSDLHWFVEGGIGDASLSRPLVLGHEFAGVIESGPRAGERVAVEPAIPCGHCVTCLAGRQHLCLEGRFAGHGTTDGALRTLLAWPAELTYRLPDTVSDAEGALLEPLGVALHALDLGQVEPGMTAGVFGCGPIGLMVVHLLHLVGATTIVATDVLAHRVAAAREMGATEAVQVCETAGDSPIDTPPLGESLDVVFETAGRDAALAQAIGMVRPGGRVVLVGIPDHDRTSFTASTARRKGLTLSLSRRMKATDLPRAIRLAEAGRAHLLPLISERYALSDGQAAFEALASRRGLKIVVEPQRT